jgi:LPXTG-site transpeptidase (sortase) family protein
VACLPAAEADDENIDRLRHNMRKALRWSQYSLWTLGLVALAYAGFVLFIALWSQHEGTRELQRHRGAAPIPGGVFGVMEVPRLGLSVVVFEGSGDDVLGRGAGHVLESATLAAIGNVVLAGHRDTFFRPLRNIRVGDVIKVRTVSAERTYVVESTRVVTPSDIGVLDPTPEPVLTLVTCYPFRYVGPAPDRFIVRAHSVRT